MIKTKTKHKVLYLDYIALMILYHLYNNTSEDAFAVAFSFLTILLFLITKGINI